jgi:hypothetical protein
MINSQNKPTRFAVAGLSFALVTFISWSVASQEKPKSLVPSFVQDQNQSVPKSAPNSVLPTTSQPVAPQAVPADQTEPKATGAFETSQLGAVHPSSISLIGKDKGVFPVTLWAGSETDYAVTLVNKLELSPKSPQSVNLFQRLLLSGAALRDADGTADLYLDWRLIGLMKAGLYDAAGQLLDRLPSNATSPLRNQLKIDVKLFSGDTAGACQLARDTELDPAAAPFRRQQEYKNKLLTFCHVLENDLDRADVKVEILQEQGIDDPLFFVLYGNLAGDKLTLENLNQRLSALHVAMIRQLKIPLNDALISAAGAPALHALVKEPEILGNKRLPVAGRLYAQGILDADQVTKYLPLEMPSDLGDDIKYGAYYGRLSAVKSAETPEEKAGALTELWQGAETFADYRLLSDLTLADLARLPVADYSLEFAVAATKVLLLHKKEALALNWERTARRAAFKGSTEEKLEARKQIARLDTYVLLSGVRGIARWNAGSFDDWLAATGDDDAQADIGTFLLSQFEVFGYPTSKGNWQQLMRLDQPLRSGMANHTLENNLVQAASSRKIGEVIALAQLSLAGVSLDEVSLTSLRAVTAGLKAAGLEKEARQMALEVALAKGL